MDKQQSQSSNLQDKYLLLQREKFIFQWVIIGISFVILFVILPVVLYFVVPGSNTLNTEQRILPKQQATIYTYADPGIDFKSEDSFIRAYIYEEETFKSFETKSVNQQFSLDETVEGYSYTYVPLYECNNSIKYSFTMSEKASVYLVDRDTFRSFMLNPEDILKYVIADLFVTQVNRSYDVSGNKFIVVFNPNSNSIKVTGSGEYQANHYDHDSTKALDVCSMHCSMYKRMNDYKKIDDSSAVVILVEHRSSDAWGTFSEGYDVFFFDERDRIVRFCFPSTGVVGLILLVSVFFSHRTTKGAFKCSKNSFNIPLIVIGAVAVVMVIVFTILFFTLPVSYDGNVCNNIYSVGSAYQSSCTSFDNSDGAFDVFFKADDSKVSAYQYKLTDYLKLGKEVRTNTFSVDETIPANSFKVLFNASLVPEDAITPVVLHYDYEASQNVTIVLLLDYLVYLSDFLDPLDPNQADQVTYSESRCDVCLDISCEQCNCTVDQNSIVPNNSFSVNLTKNYYVLALNENPSPVTLTGTGGYNTTFRLMDKSKAIKVCEDECTFSDVFNTRIVLDYSGTETSGVPVTILNLYLRRSSYDTLLCVMIPCLSAIVVVLIVLLLIRASASTKAQYGLLSDPILQK